MLALSSVCKLSRLSLLIASLIVGIDAHAMRCLVTASRTLSRKMGRAHAMLDCRSFAHAEVHPAAEERWRDHRGEPRGRDLLSDSGNPAPSRVLPGAAATKVMISMIATDNANTQFAITD